MNAPYSAPISSIYLLPTFDLAKFGWAPFADLRVRRLTTNRNAKFAEGE